MKFIFDARRLRAVFKFSKCFMDPKGVRATDRLAHLNCSGGMCTVTVASSFKACRGIMPCEGDDGSLWIPIVDIPKTAEVVTISDEGERITFDFVNGSVSCDKNDIDFINVFEECVPTGKPVFHIRMNPKTLISVLNAYKDCGAVALDFYGTNRPCVISSNTQQGLVTPVFSSKE